MNALEGDTGKVVRGAIWAVADALVSQAAAGSYMGYMLHAGADRYGDPRD